MSSIADFLSEVDTCFHFCILHVAALLYFRVLLKSCTREIYIKA
jgi:hypothetical protein